MFSAVSGEAGVWPGPLPPRSQPKCSAKAAANKILVFHLKRKKQYKKMQGHRQNFTEVRIKAIEADGVTYTDEK